MSVTIRINLPNDDPGWLPDNTDGFAVAVRREMYLACVIIKVGWNPLLAQHAKSSNRVCVCVDVQSKVHPAVGGVMSRTGSRMQLC